MGPSIIPASQLGLTNRSGALKQRSPADGCRAVGKIHRIEKMNHCGSTSLDVEAGWVKLRPRSSRTSLGNWMIATDACGSISARKRWLLRQRGGERFETDAWRGVLAGI